ncbi:thermonuclease family protein [Erythrobacter sp. YJ-T3-07]|uniref:thermonuclease family protein n=1 Tax=Erythrobacter sp. YJ-T3-07 TaxID=2793063 RepID=UPI001F3B3FC8|nr:thermonuclease family protein [Erythrobacter sp. YJ-T3-07]
MTGERVRLFGIDAPEAQQTCTRGGETWNCGEDATLLLAAMIHGKPIHCEQRDRDDYGRMVAVCRAGDTDLAATMIDAGMAIALPQFSAAYVEREANAREQALGLWGSQFELPADYRTARPQQYARTARTASSRAQSAEPPRAQVYFRNCDAARRAGAAPLYRGQPGYRSQLDGDNDGIACEPYRRRK